MLTPELREYAATPDRFALVPAGASVTRYDDGRICIIQGPTWAAVSAPNVGEDELDDLVEQVRELVPATKRHGWWLSPSARPTDIYDRLTSRGFTEPADGVGLLHAVILTRAPAAPTGIEVRRIATFDDFLAAREVQWDAFGVPEQRREVQRPQLRNEFEESIAHGVPVGFLAMLDGRPAGNATAIPSERGVFLIAGSTVDWARGRGLYRALVRARWDFAVERGTPALVTHAVPETSYPILQRLGFEDVCTIRRLEDPR